MNPQAVGPCQTINLSLWRLDHDADRAATIRQLFRKTSPHSGPVLRRSIDGCQHRDRTGHHEARDHETTRKREKRR